MFDAIYGVKWVYNVLSTFISMFWPYILLVAIIGIGYGYYEDKRKKSQTNQDEE